jgi:RsiW-degrading membrane proteinase PrsW (M82 family)
MLDYQTILYAFVGGVLPAIVWLLFWLREDSQKPEPRILIIKTFILGMLMVPAVIPFQIVINNVWPGITVVTFLLWATIEETFKLVAAYWGGLNSQEDDEPLDPLIYIITAALGFAALENALFLFSPLLDNDFAQSIITGNQRFIGATLLHTVSSGIIGVALALSFYKPKWRILLLPVSFAGAVAFHTLFNVFISSEANSGPLFAFGAVWVGVALILILFEKVKTIAR